MIEKAYAKINLTLEIVGKTKDYHLLESVVVPINIFDTLTFTKSDTDIVISNVQIKNNNIYEAIKLFKETYNIKEHVKIILDKQIPIAYGIGGSSADISATLRGLNKFFNLNRPLKELEPLANALGSDTLFCLYNKRAYIYGRGDKIKLLKSGEILSFLIIFPEEKLLTKEVFKQYEKTNKSSYIGFLNKSPDYIINKLKNDLKDAAFSINENLKTLYEKLKKENLNIGLTGSGPAMFIVNPTKTEIARVKEILNNKVKYQITKEII